MKKLFITPKEASEKLEISLRRAQRIFRNIRFVLKKKKHHFITLKELADYLGFDEGLITGLL